MPTTLVQLRTSIKIEARVTGTDELDPWLTDLINQVILDYTESNRYQELLVLGTPITVVSGQGTYTLPEDFQHLERVGYSRCQDGPFDDLITTNDFVVRQTSQGYPRFYRLAGTVLSLWPSSLLVADQDRLQLDYYKAHPDLVADGDPLLVPSLKNVIIQATVARTHVYYKEFQAAQALTMGAMKSNVVGQSSSEVKHG